MEVVSALENFLIGCLKCLCTVLAPLQNGVGQDITNPSWKRSLPHVLLATIVPFLFGYHLGFVFSLVYILVFCSLP